MRRITSLTVFAGLFALAATGASAQEGQGAGGAQDVQVPPDGTQFVYINSQRIIENAPGASEAQQTWQQELSQYQQELQAMAADLDSLQQAYQQQEGMLSEQARQQRQEEIVELQRQLQQRRAELDQQATQRQQELLSPILQQVQGVIEEVREERGYVMVFDAATPGLLAADPSLDITGLVLQRMRSGAGGGGGGAEGAGDDGVGPGGS